MVTNKRDTGQTLMGLPIIEITDPFKQQPQDDGIVLGDLGEYLKTKSDKEIVDLCDHLLNLDIGKPNSPDANGGNPS